MCVWGGGGGGGTSQKREFEITSCGTVCRDGFLMQV